MPHSEFTLKPEGVTALSLQNPTDRFISTLGGDSDDARFLRVESAFCSMFAIQKWHKLYAGALMENDSFRLCLFIVLAEEAILDRCMALFGEASESDEILDLRAAKAVLLELREINEIRRTASQIVA